ncbi:MAG: AIR synthase related protein [Myxococcota bacterium]
MTLPVGKLPTGLLGELLQLGPSQANEVLLGPAVGEDACAIRVPAGILIAATDPITLTGREVGAHAVKVNANDIAVMGARPRWFLAAILLPVGTDEAAVREVFEGIRAGLDEVGAVLVGGHTEITRVVTQPVVVGQMLGLCERNSFLRTGGATAGDVVLQVGSAPIEGAAVLAAEASARLASVGLELLDRARNALRSPGISIVRPALRAVELGATALHDPTEGGLSAGLYELAEASGIGLELDGEAVLWFEPGTALCAVVGADPWGTLASGTLLAVFPAALSERALEGLEADGYSTSAIATARTGSGVRFADGRPLARYERDELSRVLGSG